MCSCSSGATVAKSRSLAEVVGKEGHHEQDVLVEISYDVIQLLSDHLYSSPLKAIEELMVNAWDADATEFVIEIDREGALVRIKLDEPSRPRAVAVSVCVASARDSVLVQFVDELVDRRLVSVSFE